LELKLKQQESEILKMPYHIAKKRTNQLINYLKEQEKNLEKSVKTNKINTKSIPSPKANPTIRWR